MNDQFCQWLRTNRSAKVISGDISQVPTQIEILKCAKEADLLTGGVSCQPFSRMGDGRQSDDERSASFTSLLKLGYHMKPAWIIMECTQEVFTSEWAQKHLATFCEQTKYKLSQEVLHLHKIWPGRRTRWWALLTHPDLPAGTVKQLPELIFEPTILHFLPRMLKEPQNEMTALELDLVELMGFQNSRKGIQAFCINMFKTMPTATHSWGSQFCGCECGCREYGFRQSRIDQKGLHAVLVPTGVDKETNFGMSQRIRHMHAREVATLSGLDPRYIPFASDRNARLDLAGVGQMASPIQSAWVCAQAFAAMDETDLFPPCNPTEVLGRVIQGLFSGRDEVWDIQGNTRLMNIFEETIYHALGLPRDSERSLDHHIREHLYEEESKDLDIIPERPRPFTDSHVEAPAEHVHQIETSDGHGHQADTSEAPAGRADAPIDHAHRADASVDHPQAVVDPDEETPCLPLPPQVGTGGAAMSDVTSPCDTDPTPIPCAMPLVESPTTNDPPRGRVRDREGAGGDVMEADPYSNTGGVQEFAVQGISSKKPRIEETISPTADWPCTPPGLTTIPQVETEVKDEPDAPRPEIGDTESKTNHEINDKDNSEIESESEGPKLPTGEESHRDDRPESSQDQHQPADTNMVYVNSPGEDFQCVRVPAFSTVQQLMTAESRITHTEHVKPTDAMGNLLKGDKALEDKERITFTHVGHEEESMPSTITCFTEQRLQLLKDQKGWVASDEMDFYLHQLIVTKTAITTPSMYIHNKEDFVHVLDEWVGECIHQFSDPSCSVQVFTAMLHQGHWFPMALEIDGDQCGFLTTTGGRDMCIDHPDFRSGSFTLQTLHIGQRFPHDCGFQSIAWIQQVAMRTFSFQGFAVEFAITMRQAYEYWVKMQPPIKFFHCKFGGAGENRQIESLQMLLEQHGVSRQRSKQCAEMLHQSLGGQTIANVLASPKPWRDLKARASQHQPPIQIVMSDELRAAVSQRLQEGKSWGSKQTKQKQVRKEKQMIKLSPEHLSIPSHIFGLQDGTRINQINLSQVAKNATGIAIATVEEAMPFMQLKEPLSQGGLALLIIDYDDGRIPKNVGQVKFPAQYHKTDEPILLTAAILQLGIHPVTRSLPKDMTSISEIDTQVIRVLAYKDQLPHEWDDFISRPVRMIMSHETFQGEVSGAILDLWDRQWMDANFRRSQPPEAYVFTFLIRVPASFASDLLDASGQHGIYTEPRDDTGRNPSPSYRVIWLPKKGHSDTRLAVQTSSSKTWMVRNGTRYGLRVRTEHAPMIHREHRPDVHYVDGAKKQFRIGPLPWGTTRTSLQAVLKQWGWDAIAGQPQGQLQGTEGTFWSASAAGPPSHWVFTMSHGDVLITSKDDKPSGEPPKKAVVASGKSWRAMQSRPAPSAGQPNADPWLEHDPWARFSGTEKNLPTAQLAELEAKLLEKVKSSTSNDDVAMEHANEQRMTQLEEQVKQLSTSVHNLGGSVNTLQQNQQQQNQQHAEVVSEIKIMKKHIETQGDRFQKSIDAKFADQMTQIDSLLSKRLKTAE
eukprot:Skav206081  [mRNA]  locus=scaffold2150:21012:25601:- [translate_table: standard]